jgi:NADP-dependent aldehyde dehydrogenase
MIDHTIEEIDELMAQASSAATLYRNSRLHDRAIFMRAIAAELESAREQLIATAFTETHLPELRLNQELTRTIFQMTSYADTCESGLWLDVRIDEGSKDRNPPKPSLAKTMLGLGPVVVFGAANFPFAYSTAGGDTACAFAAGCPVIVKGHPGHLETSVLVGELIAKAAAKCFLPKGIYTHVIGNASAVGEALVKHAETKAVGFTGSFAGGKQLFDWGNQRRVPIPVFAEMSSVNPVFLLPEKMTESAIELASMLAPSITLNMGQFCTNPGIIVGVDNASLTAFIDSLSEKICHTVPEPMLNPGIYKNYVERRALAITQAEVDQLMVSSTEAALYEGTPTLVSVPAAEFIHNPLLHQEVFGPYSIVVKCADMLEMQEVASCMEGQLTSTLMATDNDILQYPVLVDTVRNICGRFILNNVPTGVEVALAMQHGGPFPATTDSRFTAVGGDGIRRFARPVTNQNWPDELLPDELKKENTLGVWRTINGQLKK